MIQQPPASPKKSRDSKITKTSNMRIFSGLWSRNKNSNRYDLAKNSKNSLFLEEIKILRASNLFDADWYLAQYPDVAKAQFDPYLHFLMHGAKEGRNPSANFNTFRYVGRYPELLDSDVNPLIHFIQSKVAAENIGSDKGSSVSQPSSVKNSTTVSAKIFSKTINSTAEHSSAINPSQKADAKNTKPEVRQVSDLAADVVSKFSDNSATGNAKPANQTTAATTELPPLPKSSAPVKKNIKGNIDVINEKGIFGWAVDLSHPGKRVKISFYLDGVHVVDFESMNPRQDVTRAGMDGSVAGFHIPLSSGLFQNGQIIEVRANGSALKNGVRRLENVRTKGAPPLSEFLPSLRRGEVRAVTIIIPVYNAFDAVGRCLQSLDGNLPDFAQVLIMDDASSDERVPKMLEKYRGKAGFEVYRNPTNIGYTCNVNEGIRRSVGRDIVLLNSDTIVTHEWLRNLRYCAYSQERVATVTALSDNSGAFSVPEFGVYNPCPRDLEPEDVGQVVRQSGKGIGISVPTGNGFCMYIRRDALESIGGFDEKKFPRGYGEENEFCMRAVYAGWFNLVCDKSYVLHQRSQSFQGEKTELIAAGSQQVLSEYPEYKVRTKRFSDMEFSLLRARIRGNLHRAKKENILPRILYVISTQTGGTPQTNLDLMRAMVRHYDCWLMRCDSQQIYLSRLQGKNLVEVETISLFQEVQPYTHRSDEYDRIMVDVMYRYSIDLLHIRHIAWHSLGLADAAKALSIPVIFSAHDFYTVCQSVNLIDVDNKFCGTAYDGEKINPLWPLHPIPAKFSRRWRDSMRAFLEKCDHLITTTASAVTIFGEVYPDIDKKFTVIPHGRDFDKFHTLSDELKAGERIRVLIPGNISITKGALIIEELAKLDVDQRFEFHFLGNVVSQVKFIGVQHGTYGRHEFTDKVAAIRPHIGFVFSIWPETYCHTLTEMWACGIPAFGVDMGAVGDRIRDSGAGWLIRPDATAEEIYNYILKIVNDRAELSAKHAAIKQWQETEGTYNTTETMAAEYRSIYHRLMNPTLLPLIRMGVLLKRVSRGRHWPTAHIRVLRPLSAASESNILDIRPVTSQWVAAGGGVKLDTLLIQRDAVDPKDTDAVVAALEKSKTPWIYEIDDVLWKLPDQHKNHGIGQDQVASILKLIASATVVTCSTDDLAAKMKSMAKRIKVIPNAHDERLWLTPLSEQYIAKIGNEYKLKDGRQRLLYMGSKSHASDLAMVHEALQIVKKKFPDLHIVQIGGGQRLPMGDEIERPDNLFEYHDFVNWFRAICANSTMAIAPLVDNEFNEGKSDIKSLDYGFASIPAVYSKVRAYRTIVHKQTGLLVENQSEAWADMITEMLTKKAVRSQIRKTALEKSRRLRRDGIANVWLEVIKSVARKPSVITVEDK